jgi:hypothetical protein
MISMGKPLALVGVVIGAVVVVLLLGALTGVFFNSIAGINENLTEASTGDDTADTILTVFPIVVGVSAVLGFVGLVLAAVAFARTRGS